jgi:beta-galactosidase/beta-glucuronidase
MDTKKQILVLLFALFFINGWSIDSIPRAEYPRPQFVKEKWVNLNGLWTYQFDFGNSGTEQDYTDSKGFDHSILVPFCPESKLSGVEYTDFINYMWYHRKVMVPQDWANQRIQLNFGAVDYLAEIFINGEFVGRHYGGTSSFSFPVTHHVTPGKEFDLVVRVEDHTRSGEQNLGKQSKEYEPRRTRYTRTTGIWQTVWMEATSHYGLEKCQILPDLDQKKFDFIPQFFGVNAGQGFRIQIYDAGQLVAQETFRADNGKVCTVTLHNVKTWSPENPFLYDIVYQVLDWDDKVLESVGAYAGMRKIHIEGDMVFLNNKPFYQRLVLDQGFYPDGIWTAPNDQALKRDIELSMQAGFNGARLHQKVFEERYHYWADRLGYITWGESSSWGMDANNPVAARNFIAEWSEIVERDRNHPSIIIWTPFNESIFTLEEKIRFNPELRKQHDRMIIDVYDLTKRLDPSRPVNDVSGYLHIKTDIWSGHCYEQDPEKLQELLSSIEDNKPYTGHREYNCRYEGEPFIIDEFGGIKWNPANQDNSQQSWGYGHPPNSLESYYKRLKAHVDVVLSLENCVGYCYTQLTDVESEQNGIYYYSREEKFDMEIIRQIFSKVPVRFQSIEKKQNDE